MRTGLSAARRRVLAAVARREAPVLLTELAAELGGHPNTTRQQLEALTRAGLVTATLRDGHERGRRPYEFAISAEGRRALGGGEDRTGVVGAVAAYLVRRVGGLEEARAMGEVWGERHAAAVPADAEPVEALVEVLDTMGFEPRRAEVDGQTVVTLGACPLLSSTDDPAALCEMHRGMINAFVRHAGAATGMELRPFAAPGRCDIVGQPADPTG